MAETRAVKISAYEDLVNEKLRRELQDLHDQRDKAYEHASQHAQLRSSVESLLEQKNESLKMMVDLRGSRVANIGDIAGDAGSVTVGATAGASLAHTI